MMNSLFESFDPQMSFMGFNSSTLMVMSLIPAILFSLFISPSRPKMIKIVLSKVMFSELSASSNNKNNNSNVLILISSFMLVLSLNLMGLIPYVFTATSQMMFSLSLSLPLWLSLILFSLSKNTNHFLSHLVPLSTPMALSQFMVIIESVSQLIRPITLSVRLCANMTAGHILMALASQPIFAMNLASLSLMILLVLEIAVAFIQSYVFVMLTSMYLSETT